MVDCCDIEPELSQMSGFKFRCLDLYNDVTSKFQIVEKQVCELFGFPDFKSIFATYICKTFS